MKPPPFEYHRPESLDETTQILAEHGDDARLLAGGQSLVPLLSMRLTRPRHLVDLQRVAELRRIAHEDGRVRIGATVRQRDVERNARMPGLVKAAIPHIATFQVRNRGTVGGSMSHMDPAAEWPAAALVLDGVVVAESRSGRREIPAEAFVVGPHMTALRPDEVLVEVILPVHEDGFGFAEVTRRGLGDYALAGAACQGTRVAVFGAGPRAQRLRRVEQLLTDSDGTRITADVAAVAASEIEAIDDVHASSDYRRQVAAALVSAVVAQSRRSGGDER